MKVIYVSSEVVPFAKTGGLAEIAGTIPKNLKKLGVDIIIIMPLYKVIKENNFHLIKTDIQVETRIGDKIQIGYVYKGFLPNTNVPIYFLECEKYYNREGLYNYPGSTEDYEDNCERFVFFSRSIFEIVEKLNIHPDIVHCNDWQAGLTPVFLKTIYAGKKCFKNTKAIMTIHNIAYQGLFWHWDMKLTGLDWSLFNWKQLEFYGKINFLKGGIVFSDIITTVSKTYAQEIQTPEFGVGLDGVLRERSKDLYGIINGIDYNIWNPETDGYIAANYGVKNLSGKRICKKALQKKYKLSEKESPIIGMITRLTNQKGLDLVVNKFQNLMKANLQFILLGTGDQQYQLLFQDYAKMYQDKVAANFSFDEQSAHEIEAGADIFLMPSRFEPCGLNQLYSLKYGTVPVVRSTGGLADTIKDVSMESVYNGKVNGFSFKEYSSESLLNTIAKALCLFEDKAQWLKLMKNGMEQDWSWERSAKEYSCLYEKIIGDRQ